MSKKKPYRIISNIGPNGEFISRELVFRDKKGKKTKVKYPEDSTVIIISPTEVYDWLGRRVEFWENIECLIRPYGSEPHSHAVYDSIETFLVKKKNGMLAIAIIHRPCNEDENSTRIPSYKQSYTGYYIDYKPTLIPDDEEEFERIDNSILKTPVMKAFFECATERLRCSYYDIFVGVNCLTRAKPTHRSVIRTNTGTNPRLWHHLAISRDAILSSSNDQEPNYIQYATFLDNEIKVSDDGNKLSVIYPYSYEGKKYGGISTDLEIVRHMAGSSCLWWYYDDSLPV